MVECGGDIMQAARPTIAIDGEARSALAEALVIAEVRETVEGLYSCELRFDNWRTDGGYAWFDRETLDFGKHVELRFDKTPVFRGRISALTGHFPHDEPPLLVVQAEDRLQDLRMTRRTRSFHDLDDAALVRRIAGEHGLQVDVDLDGPTHPVLAQVNESDLAFLRRRLRCVDGELWLDDDQLKVRRRDARGETTLALAYRGNLYAFTVSADLATQRSALRVSGWDRGAKEAIAHRASDQSLAGELGDGPSGASVLVTAFGERLEQVAHAVPLDQAEARAEAEARFRLQARRFLVGEGRTDPDAALRVGTRIEVSRVGPLFGGTYDVTEVCHRFAEGVGSETHFRCERPWLGRPGSG